MAANAQSNRSSRSAFVALVSSFALLSAGSMSSAAFTTPDWSRSDPRATVQAWDIFTSPAGPNAPSAASTSFVPGFSNSNGTPNTFDTTAATDGAFITGGGNIYSFSAPTHIQSNVPSFNLGSTFYTTVLVQTRTLGSEADYSSFKLTYNNGSTNVTVSPVASKLLSSGGASMGGATIDFAAAFYIPYSPSTFSANFDASSSSMSLDIVIIDTLTSPEASGFAGVSSVPEPTTAVLAAPALALLKRRRK